MSWLATPGAATLARTLLHSLWEGAAVALALAVVLCFVRSARVRYAAACIAMVALLCALAATFVRLSPVATENIPVASPGRVVGSAAKQIGNALPSPRGQGSQSIDYLAWAVPVWIAGMFVFYVRGLVGWIAAWRLRRIGVCCAPEMWRSRMDRLRLRLRLSRAVLLLESSLAEVPVVMGYLRPMILMPVGMLAGLPAAQVEAILLHELAHIRRYDYVVNLLQVFVEGLLFYHPAIWWISGVIRTEREYCCDDLVVNATGGALEYATALTALEQRRMPGAILAATGGSLVNRVERLLGRPQRRSVAAIPVLTAALMTVSLVSAVMAFQAVPARVAVVPPPLPMLAQAEPSPTAPQRAVTQPVVPVPTSTPVNTPAVPDRKIDANDLISISVLDEPEVSKAAVRVGADGTIALPLLSKPLHVAGLLPREVETLAAREFIDQQILVHPSVSVAVLEYSVRHISVVGDVKIPGQFDITGPITLVEAMAKAGWTTAEAGPDLLFSKSATDVPRKINILQLQSSTDAAINLTLTGGEVISVPDAPKVWVTGHVAHAQAVPLRDDAASTVLHVMERLEGAKALFSKTAYIYRPDGSGKRQEIEVPLRDIMHGKAPDVRLLPDDILLIPDDNLPIRGQAPKKEPGITEPKMIDTRPPMPPGLLKMETK